MRSRVYPSLCARDAALSGERTAGGAAIVSRGSWRCGWRGRAFVMVGRPATLGGVAT